MIHLDLGPLLRPCCYIKKEYLNPISVAVAAAYSAAVLAVSVAAAALAAAAGSEVLLVVADPSFGFALFLDS